MNISDLIKIGFVGAVLVLAESIREQCFFKVTKYQVKTNRVKKDAVKSVRVVFLSDLHNREYGKKNARLLHAIREQKPDLILIGGDMLVGKPGCLPEPAWRLVSQLPRIAPVYYANGNHEQRMKESPEKYGNVYKAYRQELTDAGIHFLENDSAVVTIHGQRICLTGLELPMSTYEKFKKYPLTVEEIEACVGGLHNKVEGAAVDQSLPYQILLAHNPVYAKVYHAWGAELVLSGHLHGGMARIPGWRGFITPQAFLFPKYSGEMTVEGAHTTIVSRGLGTHTINFRLFNSPELVVFELTA